MTRRHRDVSTYVAIDGSGNQLQIIVWYSGGGLVYYRMSDGRRGAVDSEPFFMLDRGELSCPTCGQDFQLDDEFRFIFGNNSSLQVSCELCDIGLTWSEEKNSLVEKMPVT